MIHVLRNKYLPFLFAIPLYLSFCHYEGLIYDAILYVTQYVYSIDPLRFWGDPAFDYGNQDSLGLFSPIFGIFLEWFGVSTGAFVYTFLMQLAWVIVAVLFVKSFLWKIKGFAWVLPVTVMMMGFFAYGIEFAHIRFFRYIESYACSRSLSIVLGIGALAFLFTQKKFFSLLLIIAGTIIHPITAGWCLPFWMFYFFPKTRIPVLVVSFIFPFSYLLHWGPFDFLPTDWLSRPLAFKPEYADVSRYILLIAFFMSLAKKTKDEEIRKISISSIILLAISLYWDMWGGIGEHVFLYQVQTWRAVWLPSIIAVPLGACCFKDSLRKIAKGRNITTSDLGIMILLLSFLAPRNIIVVSAVAMLLVVIKTREVPLKSWVAICSIFLFVGFLVQQYLTWFLQGFPSFLDIAYTDLYRIRDSFLFYQFCFSVAFGIYFIKKKKFLPAILLITSIFFAHFLLLSVLALFLAFFPKEKRFYYFGGAAFIVILMLFDGLIDVDARRMTLIEGMPRCFPWVCISLTLSLLSMGLFKKVPYWGILVWLPICAVMAVVLYNGYSVKWREKELHIDKYLHESVFPQVKERGKMLFYVSGELEMEPWLQFLTGCYQSRSSMVGSIFNKEHYRTSLERSHLLFLRERDPQSEKYYIYGDILPKLANLDTLIDRVNFLCGINEISHLVSDRAPLPFVKEDSTMVNESQKVYLYGCPSVE